MKRLPDNRRRSLVQADKTAVIDNWCDLKFWVLRQVCLFFGIITAIVTTHCHGYHSWILLNILPTKNV